ncbi:MAG: phosphoglucosamine mutase [Bacteroidota bacterium]
MALMISVSGIRGIFGTDLTPENLAGFTAAYGTWLKGGTVVLGRDSRVTGQICEDIVAATLMSVGCDVIKLGIVPTPTVAMGVLKHQAAGGIIISASHNPAEWNALKLLNSKSEFLDAEEGKAVIEIAQNREAEYQPFDRIGVLSQDEHILDYHIRKILELPFIDTDKIRAANFRVAIDAVNGAGSHSVPVLLSALGVNTVHEIHTTPNGLFPHNPEPLPEHLEDICALVKEHGASIGFVTDPDADRLAVVDNNGELWGEEYTQTAAFDFILSKTEGSTATNLSSSRVATDITERHGQVNYRSAVGEINVVKTMQEFGSVVGGEGNGGVIVPELHYGRDALVGIAIILQLLAERNQTASEYRASLPGYEMSKNKIQLSELGKGADQVLEKVRTHYADLEPNTIDGVKIDFEEGWVHLRKSNTEPIVRIYSEGKTKAEADGFAQKIIRLFA